MLVIRWKSHRSRSSRGFRSVEMLKIEFAFDEDFQRRIFKQWRRPWLSKLANHACNYFWDPKEAKKAKQSFSSEAVLLIFLYKRKKRDERDFYFTISSEGCSGWSAVELRKFSWDGDMVQWARVHFFRFSWWPLRLSLFTRIWKKKKEGRKFTLSHSHRSFCR